MSERGLMAVILGIVGAIAFMSVVAVVSPAEAAVYKRDAHTLEISGPTTRRQAAEAIKEMRTNDIKRVIMWGEGGDFYAGLAIGIEIQREGASVQVPTGRRCVSACAFAAVASDKVMLGGELWFHTAYIPEYPLVFTLEQISTLGQQTGVQTLYYAYKVDLPAVFIWEIMGSTNACKFLVISDTSSVRQVTGAGFDDKINYRRRTVDECFAHTR